METLILHPENKEQLDALKAIAKALKIPFEKKKELSEREKTIKLYGKDLVEQIEEADSMIKKGDFVVLDPDKTLWENIK